MTPNRLRISEEQQRQYREEGYFLLDQAIRPQDLEILRGECTALVREQEAEMDRQKSDQLNLSRRNSRYFIFLPLKERPNLSNFIFNDLMAEICRATIGETAYLFWEQFVVKGTDKKGAEFGWHQDSGYTDGPHKAYVNAWIPLDDVDERNGTISILPFSRAGTREKVEHKILPGVGDRVGYFGSDPGVLASLKAGSIAVFSSHSFHRSGANGTAQMRRAYSLQYSPEIIYEPDGSLKGLDIPFLQDGKRLR